MNNEYIIINKTDLLKMRGELEKGSVHSDGVYIGDYQMAQINLIDAIIKSQSTPLIPEIEKAFDAGSERCEFGYGNANDKHDYISNLKLDI